MFRLISLLLLIYAQIAVAAHFTDGNFHFRTISPTECEVYGTTLSGGVLKIPATATFKGKKLSVVKIAQSRDRWNDFHGKIEIPEGVVSIGDSAFAGCSSLTGSLVIPNSVTSIGTAAFMGCGGFSGSLTIGKNVSSIGQSAFYRCSSISGQLVIPEGITEIPEGAFYHCGFTGSLTIPESVVAIGKDV